MDQVVVTYEHLHQLAARVAAVADDVELLRAEQPLQALAAAMPGSESAAAAEALGSFLTASRGRLVDALRQHARSLLAAAATYGSADR